MKAQRIFCGIVLAALVGVGSASAQNIGGGVKGGVNFATVSGTSVRGATQSMRTTWGAGGFLTIGITDMIAFQPGK